MNTSILLAENNTGIRTNVTRYPLDDRNNFANGTKAWAWIIGRGRINPAVNTANPHGGATQDLGVLTVEMPLR